VQALIGGFRAGGLGVIGERRTREALELGRCTSASSKTPPCWMQSAASARFCGSSCDRDRGDHCT